MTSVVFQTGSSQSALQTALTTVMQSGASIIYVAAWMNDTMNVFSAAQTLGMTGSGWVWLTTEYATILTPNSTAQTNAMQGIVAPKTSAGYGNLFNYLQIVWRSRFVHFFFPFFSVSEFGNLFSNSSVYPGSIFTSKYSLPGSNVAQTFDCVYAFFQAIDYCINNGINYSIGSNLRTALLTMPPFTGTTGVVQFDQNGNPNPPAYDIVNLNGLFWNRVGMWNLVNGTSLFPGSLIVWPGGMINVPTTRYAVQVTGFFPSDPSLNGTVAYTLAIENQAAFR